MVSDMVARNAGNITREKGISRGTLNSNAGEPKCFSAMSAASVLVEKIL